MRPCVVCQVSIDDQARFCPSCGAEQPKSMEATSQTDPLIGHIVDGKYRLDSVIGVGGMGRVYKAVQLSLDKTIVIKILHDKYRDDDIIVQRFQREAKASSRLSHPNSIQIIDFGMEDKVLYMAMEFLDGVDLFQLFKEAHPLGEERIAHIMVQICTALGEAHGQNIIHRDLKPENIMVLNRSGQKDFVKVLDFGIAKILDSDQKEEALTQVGMVCGTPEYMSPEQARGETLDARSDIYALGVLLYQLCTGDLPFDSDTAVGLATKHILEEPVRPSQRAPDLKVSPEIEKIIMCAMAKNVDDRFPDVLKMADALMKILEGGHGSMATMPDMEAVDTQAVSRPKATQAFLGQMSSGHGQTDPGTQSDTAVKEAEEYLAVKDLDESLHSHELDAVGKRSFTNIYLGGALILLISVLTVGLLGFMKSQDEVELAPSLKAVSDVGASQIKAPEKPQSPPIKKDKPAATPPKIIKKKTQATKITPKSKSAVPPPKRKASTSRTKTRKNRSLAQSLYQKGNQLIADGSLKQGLSTLKKAKKADSSFAEVYRALATAHKMNGDNDSACRAINQFLKKKKLGAGRQNAYQKRYCQ